VGVVEQGACGEAGGGEGGQGGCSEQHVHDDDLVADGGQRADPGQDQPGHCARQADQADGLGGVDRGDQRGAQRRVQVRGERLGGGLTEAQAGLDGGAGSSGFVTQPCERHGGGGHGAGDDHAADRDHHPRLRADHAQDEQGADGGGSPGRDGTCGDRQRPRQATGAAGGDLPGDQHHDGEPAECADQPAVGKDEQ
jgi:hypothetical protein